MKIQKLFLLAALVVVATSCAHRVRIMNATAVSMTEYSSPKGMKLKEIGPIEDKWCTDSDRDSGTVGLLDEAVKAAQKKSGADFITNATFYREGVGCIVVNGTAMKKVKGRR